MDTTNGLRMLYAQNVETKVQIMQNPVLDAALNCKL